MLQPKTPECCRRSKKNLVEKRMQLHTHKLKEERSYKMVLKGCSTQSTLKKSTPKLKN
jgi:hypothetical protein